jgi:hypothetical protein
VVRRGEREFYAQAGSLPGRAVGEESAAERLHAVFKAD